MPLTSHTIYIYLNATECKYTTRLNGYANGLVHNKWFILVRKHRYEIDLTQYSIYIKKTFELPVEGQTFAMRRRRRRQWIRKHNFLFRNVGSILKK